MPAERKTIYIDDVTGRQIASPADARNGGSRTLRDADAERWLRDNPDLVLGEKQTASAEEKAQEPTANKARARAEDK